MTAFVMWNRKMRHVTFRLFLTISKRNFAQHPLQFALCYYGSCWHKLSLLVTGRAVHGMSGTDSAAELTAAMKCSQRK